MASVAERQERLEFLQQRQSSVGASDLPALFGMDQYGNTPQSVYDSKVLKITELPEGESGHLLRGQVLEPVAAKQFAELTGYKVRRQGKKSHKDSPWLEVNIDRQIIAGSENPTGVCEIKCPGAYKFKEYKRYGCPEEWMLQVQAQLGTFGYSWGLIVMFNSDEWEIKMWPVEADPANFARIQQVSGDFWNDHVLKGVRPPNLALSPDIKLPKIDGEIKERGDVPFSVALEKLKVAKMDVEQAGVAHDLAKEDMKELLEHTGVYEGFGSRIYWTYRAGRKTLDRKRMVAEHPEIDFKEYDKQGEPFAVFTPYFDVVDYGLE